MVWSTPRPHFTPGKDPVPIFQEAGWAPGPVWTGGKSRPHRDSIPDRPVRSSVAIPTELPGPHLYTIILRRVEMFSNPISPQRPKVLITIPVLGFFFKRVTMQNPTAEVRENIKQENKCCLYENSTCDVHHTYMDM